MKKRILILAGGVASRMKKVVEGLDIENELIKQADTLTKGMIGVGSHGKSLIDYQLYNAYKASFNDILILLHPNDFFTQEYYEEKMLKNEIWGLNIKFARQNIPSEREKPSGTADAVLQALKQHSEWQTGKLLILNSDNLYSTKALNFLWNSDADNALISYDRDALKFPIERIQAFAVIKSDNEGYLIKIIEKPDETVINEILATTGRIGVSMNAFKISAEQMLPYLESTDYHPVRNEKELPVSVGLCIADNPKSFYCIPLSENVPDLTSKNDLKIVQEYLINNFSFENDLD